MRSFRSKGGWIALNEVIALAICMGLLAGLVPVVVAHLKGGAAAEKRANDQVTLVKVQALLGRMFEGIDSYRFVVPPRIHRGPIFLADGVTPAPMPASTTMLPRDDSDAATFLELLPSLARPVSACVANNPRVKFRVCAATRRSWPETVQSVIGVGLAGMVEFTREVRGPANGGALCLDLGLERASSMIVPPAPIELCDVQLLIPVAQIGTVYVSRDSELRILQHAGDRLIENQPIALGLKRLSFALSVDPLGRYSINSSVTLASGSTSQLKFYNVLSRTPAINAILNRAYD